MNHFCPTIVIRHRKERLKKCSLWGLEKRNDLLFYPYPAQNLPLFEGYVWLCAEAPLDLSIEEQHDGLLILDATWRLAHKMAQNLAFSPNMKKRRLPSHFVTAYPRQQDQINGLASVEALYIAYLLTGRNPEGLLDHYYWKERFLQKNGLALTHE